MANSFTDTLLKEAEALSLRCFDLVPSEKGDEVSAHWGGHRSDLPEELPEFVQAYEAAKHFLSVDQKLFDQLELQGRGPLALEMFTTVEGGDVLNNVNVSTGNLNEVSFEESVPLKAKPATSLPPFEALMLYGGPVVQDWLKSQKLERWQYSDVQSPVREEYLEHFNARLPLYSPNPPYVRIGGWHFVWSDDDFYIPREMRLMVWTFADSEPWNEVFLSPMLNYVIKSRIT